MLRSAARKGRYPTDENLHVTLAFIGEYGDVERVKKALDSVSFEGFEMESTGFGNFRDIYYVGIRSKSRALDRLSAAVRHELNEANIGFDRRPFKAHVTVGRDIIVCPEDVPEIKGSVRMTVSEFSLMSSAQINGKRVYGVLHTVKCR